jgi:DNA repair exonuclease SbcCD nuclease subunit
MKIVHLSDIHWRGFKRHEEYTEIHEQLFKKLQTEIKPEAIVCTGDIFHTKTQGITPEIVEKLVWFFRRITGIAPLYLILGNHDGNLANETRQDIISPIVGAMNNEKIHLYKKSGVYEINNDFAFCVFSPFDKEGWESVVPKQEKINIALFHGAVIGCLADNETVLEKGEISLQFFSGYDFALLGDVHKRQFLDTRKTITNDFKPWIGYSGSVIQQNFGEEEEKGFLVWDIRSKNDWDVDFVALENKTPYLSIPWVNNVAETLKTVEEIRGNLQKGTRIRVISDQNISSKN